jgi:hypothetical protein
MDTGGMDTTSTGWRTDRSIDPSLPEYGGDPGGDRDWNWDRSSGEWVKRRERDAAGGLVGRGYQEGGLTSLMPNNAIDQGGFVQDEEKGLNEEQMRIVSEAKMALMGTHPNPQEAINAFIAMFGEEALASLEQQVQQGDQGQRIAGPGGGMDDNIPARIDGQQEAALSSGEYVVPADVVSSLGDGSTEAGSQQLDQMLERVRLQKTGTPTQPGKIKQREAMPV